MSNNQYFLLNEARSTLWTMCVIFVLCIVTIVAAVPQGYNYNSPAAAASDNAPQPALSQLYSSPNGLRYASTSIEQHPEQKYLPVRDELPATSTDESNRSLPSQLYSSPSADLVSKQPPQTYLPAENSVPSNDVLEVVPSLPKSYLPAEEPIEPTKYESAVLPPAPSYLPASASSSIPAVAESDAYDYVPKRQLKVSVSKHYYADTPKDYIPNYPNNYSSTTAHKHYNVIFIRAPTIQNEGPKIQQTTKEEKTVIYVLSQKTDGLQYLPQYGSPAPQLSQPEVYFIKYRTPEEASRAQEQIQAQYDALSGTGGYPAEAPLVNVRPQKFGNAYSSPVSSYLPPSY